MKVSELIEKLQRQDPDAEVLFETGDGDPSGRHNLMMLWQEPNKVSFLLGSAQPKRKFYVTRTRIWRQVVEARDEDEAIHLAEHDTPENWEEDWEVHFKARENDEKG